MQKKKEKRVKVHGDGIFKLINVILCILFIGSLVFSIVDKCLGMIPWPIGYEEIIGVSSQIITAVLSLVVSIVGIAISLQNEEFFGVKITKLYALRVTKHYSIRRIILASIFLCVINLTYYMCGLTFAAIAILVISLIFLVQVVYMEIPIMAKEENALLQILKDNLIYCHLKRKEASTDLKESIKYLLYRKNFKELYEYFKDDSDDEYNQYVVMKLLEFQHDLAFSLSDKSIEEQRIIGSSLVTNVVDIILHHIGLTEKIYEEINKNLYLLTRVLFRVNDIPVENNPVIKRISGLIQCLTFTSDELKEMDNLISSVIIILTTETVKNGDFRIIRTIRKQFSQTGWGLKDTCPALNVFAVISLQLYYLCCSEKDVPDELKSSIIEFINEKNIIEDNTKISSWKQLFAEAAEKFNVKYDDFLKLVMKHESNLEYWLLGTGAKFVVLGPAYVTQWYLTNLINRNVFSEIDFDTISTDLEKLYPRIREFGDACLDENTNFLPTDEMNRIISFFAESKEHFLYFKFYEERNHTLFNFVNKIKVEELKRESNLAEQIDSIQFASKIKESVEEALRKEWGFNATLEINNSERHFAVLLEKFPDAINFEESIIDYCIRSVFSDIEKGIQKTIVYRDENFESSIQSWLSKNVKYVTASVKNTIPEFYINDSSIKKLFESQSDSWTEVESELLGGLALVTETGFSFNCEVKEVRFTSLSEEELSKQVAKYQREDGQYVFRGTFLPKEEIAEIIKDKFGILNVTICHQEYSCEGSILELKPYLTREDDE